MIGKFIYKLLKDNISELSTGGIYPVINPQSPDVAYPHIIYNCFTKFEKSKDQQPNQRVTTLSLKIKGETYDQVNTTSNNVRDLLDGFSDSQTFGQDGLPAYTDVDGYTYNIIKNIAFDKLFFDTSEDFYDDDLRLYSRIDTYNVCWYNDILRYSYDEETTTPLFFHLDFSINAFGYTAGGGIGSLSDGEEITRFYNRVIRPTIGYDGDTPTEFPGYWSSDWSFQNFNYRPRWYQRTSTLPARAKFEIDDILGINDGNYGGGQFEIPYGGLFVFLYKPIEVGKPIVLNGKSESGNGKNILLVHEKIGSDIKIKVNFDGDSTFPASSSNTLISTTDSTNYWDADIHFLAVSFGGIPSKVGGSVTGKGWFEYFNSNYNPKETTGQILQNEISGTTDTISATQGWGNIGYYGSPVSGDFYVYETLGFVATEKRVDANDNPITPFSPGGIVYTQLKNYILNRYEQLN